MLEKFEAIITEHGGRVTDSRRKVFLALASSEHPLFLREIVAQCTTIDRTSVYRSLELFAELGIITIIPTGWKKRYELAEPFRPHHHHFVCTSCHKASSIASEQLETLIDTIARKGGFVITAHHFELSGTCRQCSK